MELGCHSSSILANAVTSQVIFSSFQQWRWAILIDILKSNHLMTGMHCSEQQYWDLRSL